MKINSGTGIRVRGCHLAVVAALAFSAPVHAVQFQWGDWSGSWDNTISYGISWRGESPDPALIGIGNGGTGPRTVAKPRLRMRRCDRPPTVSV